MSLLQDDMLSQVKRFACDRCHSQKLKCPRSSKGSEAKEPCNRCHKAGVRCNISATQKTGRPSKASKLQKSKEGTPSLETSASERRGDVSRPGSSFPQEKRSSDAGREQDINVDFPHSLHNGNQPFSTSSPSNDTFMTLEGYCTPISRDEYSEFFDCSNFETISPDTTCSQDFNQCKRSIPNRCTRFGTPTDVIH